MQKVTGIACVLFAATVVGGAAYAQTSPPAPFQTKMWQEYAEPAGGRTCVETGQGFKLIGGGASVEGAGNSLKVSYPDGDCWHAQATGGTMKVWAIGLRDADNKFDVKILRNEIRRNAASFPRVTISLSNLMPQVYTLTGGGARVQGGGIVASHPTSLGSWEAIGDRNATSITSYIIGIRATAGGALTAAKKSVTGQTPVATLDKGYSVTGGGAGVSGTGLLSSLTPSPAQAPDNKSWTASAATPNQQVTAHAVGIYSDVILNGCTSAGVTGDCLVLTTADNATYNITGASPRPANGSRIRLKGTVRGGFTTCQQGTFVDVTSWESAQGSACPGGGPLR